MHGDHIGSIRLTTDTTGTVTSKRTWDAYGNLTAHTGTANTPFGYAGAYQDPITGYDYLQARYYDPATGQFISPDPIGTTGGSGYSYVANSPLKGTDPLGLHPGDPVNNPSQLDGGCNGTIPTRPGTGQTIANFAGGVLNELTFHQLSDDPLFDRVGECTTAHHAGQITRIAILTLTPADKTGRIEGAAALEGAPNGLATEANEAVFWTGIRGGDSTAAAWASEHGGKTLETVMAERGIVLPAWGPGNPEVVAAWRTTSREVAAGASGDARVLQSDSVRVRSVWAEVGFPTLKANPNVTSITSIDPQTGEAILLWRR